MSFISGPYAWTYGSPGGPVGAAYPLGTIEDAPALEMGNEVDPISGDNLGSAMQDGIFRGGSCFLNLVLQEYNLPVAHYCFHPWATNFGDVGCVGSLLSTYADSLVGTPLSPLCTLGGVLVEGLKVITFYKAVLAPGFPIRLLFGSRLRNVPLRFAILPYEVDVDGILTKRFFHIAAP